MSRKLRSRWLAALLSLALVAGLAPAALAEGEETVPVTGVTLDREELRLLPGEESEPLKATVMPEDATDKTVNWTSSKTSVATVDQGVVTAVAPGEADIIATTQDGGETAFCTVKVEEAVSGVTLDKKSLSLKVGESGTLTATVSPETATEKTVKWTTSKESVAIVDDGRVTAVGAGTATIIATTRDGGKTATCDVTVEETPASTISLNTNAMSVRIGSSASLTATVSPGGQTVTWASDNTALATVDPTGATVNVRVPANAGVGRSCTITATVGTGKDAKEAKCVITVADMSLSLSQTNTTLNPGKTLTLALNGVPSGWSSSLSLKSDNILVATVYGTTITARSLGRAVITATPKINNKTYPSLTCTVTVINAALADVSYTASAGAPVYFNADHFNTAVVNSTGYSLNYVQFTLPSSSRGVLYYDYDASTGSYDKKVSASTRYYRGSSSYLSSVAFLPADDYTGTVNISYTAVDNNGTTLTGQVSVTVNQQQAKVTYSADANQTVAFDASDFNDACKRITGYHLDYVRFTLPTSSRGTLYLNYGAGGEKKASASTSYYRGESPYLSDLSFVPAKNYTGIVNISFTGRDVDGNSISGTLRIAVGKDPGDVNYSVDAGGSVTFDDGDFNTWCKEETGYNLDYVSFTLPQSSRGVLYYKYNTKNGSYDKKVTSSASYYRSGSPYLEDVTFVPAGGFSGTVEIDFTGRDTDKNSVSGTVAVKVNAHRDPGTIRYYTGVSPVHFRSRDFTDAFDPGSSASLSSVRFTLPDESRGRLYYDYDNTASYGGLVKSGTSYGLTGSNSVDRVAFVPKYGYHGTFTLSYTGTDTSGYEYRGAVEITVTNPDGSTHFTDMGQYGWAAASADYLYENDITQGIGSGQYDPAGLITRGDFVLMLYRAFGLPRTSGYSFDDVPTDSYYANAIASAKAEGIAQGNDGKFSPTAPLTRQDAMVLLYRTLDAVDQGLDGGWSLTLWNFNDGGSVAEYAEKPVAALVQAGVIQGDDSGNLNPAGSLTRAEMAVILQRVLTL